MATIDAYLMSFQYKILSNRLYLNKNFFVCVNIAKLGICDANSNT